MHRGIKVMLGIFLLFILAAGVWVVRFGVLPERAVVGETTAGAEHVMTKQEVSPVVALEAGVVEADEGLVFDFTPGDFIASYNGYYGADKGEDYLRPLENWQSSQVERAVQMDVPATEYRFRTDESKWTLPQFRITVPEGGEQVSQVAVTYDEHSYSAATYTLFEEDCNYTLRTFFPDLDDAVCKEIVQTLNQAAYDHTFPSSQKYQPGTTQLPAMLYQRDGLGVFSYFAIGAPVYFCVIPVDDALLAEYTASGVDVREIS